MRKENSVLSSTKDKPKIPAISTQERRKHIRAGIERKREPQPHPRAIGEMTGIAETIGHGRPGAHGQHGQN